jgi:hypothetical protein
MRPRSCADIAVPPRSRSSFVRATMESVRVNGEKATVGRDVREAQRAASAPLQLARVPSATGYRSRIHGGHGQPPAKEQSSHTQCSMPNGGHTCVGICRTGPRSQSELAHGSMTMGDLIDADAKMHDASELVVCRQAKNGDLRLAACEGMASGLREHMPGAVGIVTKGLPLCAEGAFAHLVLGIEIPGVVPVLIASAGASGSVWRHKRRRDDPRHRS